jgi:hypothetical protein
MSIDPATPVQAPQSTITLVNNGVGIWNQN